MGSKARSSPSPSLARARPLVEFWEILWVIPTKLLSILHSGVQACGRVAGQQSPSLPVIVGVKLAPVIFILLAATLLFQSSSGVHKVCTLMVYKSVTSMSGNMQMIVFSRHSSMQHSLVVVYRSLKLVFTTPNLSW